LAATALTLRRRQQAYGETGRPCASSGAVKVSHDFGTERRLNLSSDLFGKPVEVVVLAQSFVVVLLQTLQPLSGGYLQGSEDSGDFREVIQRNIHHARLSAVATLRRAYGYQSPCHRLKDRGWICIVAPHSEQEIIPRDQTSRIGMPEVRNRVMFEALERLLLPAYPAELVLGSAAAIWRRYPGFFCQPECPMKRNLRLPGSLNSVLTKGKSVLSTAMSTCTILGDHVEKRDSPARPPSIGP